MKTGSLLKRCRVVDGDGFRLRDHDPASHHGLTREAAEAMLADGIARLASLQRRLYADGRHALLVVLQAMDAAGKDGTIAHVMTGVNPQGVQVTSFKAPAPSELAHDFLWRVHAAAPRRGMIGLFNRSHYEEVLVCRVHPEMLAAQSLPGPPDAAFWRHRLADIAQFEAYLGRQGTTIVKIFLHLSKAEQRRRFLARLDTPDKTWKFSAADLRERERWDDYQDAYETAIAATASKHAPWYVVPADHKWYAHWVVVEALIHALERLELTMPTLSEEEATRLAEAREALEDRK